VRNSTLEALLKGNVEMGANPNALPRSIADAQFTGSSSITRVWHSCLAGMACPICTNVWGPLFCTRFLGGKWESGYQMRKSMQGAGADCGGHCEKQPHRGHGCDGL
jgi:hypothetical protein